MVSDTFDSNESGESIPVAIQGQLDKTSDGRGLKYGGSGDKEHFVGTGSIVGESNGIVGTPKYDATA